VSTTAREATERRRLFRKANAYDDIRVILAAIPKKGLCLDLPAGRGVNLDGIRAAGFTPVAADLFAQKTRAGGAPCARVNFLQPLPFRDGAFAAVLCSEGIEHHSAQTELLRELARILQPGGTLVITTPNILSLRARLAYCLNGNYSFRRKPISEVTQLWGGKYLGHVHLVDYLKLRFMLWQAGFELRQVTTAKYSLSSMALAPLLYLPVRLATSRIFRRSLREQPEACKEILDHTLSADLLYGKKLIVVAEKRAAAGGPNGN
jgi:SAM-dependent methyltransferase